MATESVTKPRQATSSPAAPEDGDWRRQPVNVAGRAWALADVHGGTFFHGSPVDLPDGTVLSPGHFSNFDLSPADAVCITSQAGFAHRWGHCAAWPGTTYYVYEVEPLGVVTPHRVALANHGQNIQFYEGRVPAARIIRKVAAVTPSATPHP